MIKVIAFDVGGVLLKYFFWKNKKVLDLAISLKKKYKVGIISNIDKFPSILPMYQQVYSNFDENLVILSFQVKSNKPGNRIFEIFIERTGLAPDECLFIDNVRKNVISAEEIGMKGIVFKNFDQLLLELTKFGIQQ